MLENDLFWNFAKFAHGGHGDFSHAKACGAAGRIDGGKSRRDSGMVWGCRKYGEAIFPAPSGSLVDPDQQRTHVAEGYKFSYLCRSVA
jgi:hypothetical protein